MTTSDENKELSTDKQYQDLLARISQTYSEARVRAYQTVNVQMLETYWQSAMQLSSMNKGAKFGQSMESRCLLI